MASRILVCVCVFLNTCIAQAIEGWALAENKKKFIEHGKHNLKYNQRIVCTVQAPASIDQTLWNMFNMNTNAISTAWLDTVVQCCFVMDFKCTWQQCTLGFPLKKIAIKTMCVCKRCIRLHIYIIRVLHGDCFECTTTCCWAIFFYSVPILISFYFYKVSAAV